MKRTMQLERLDDRTLCSVTTVLVNDPDLGRVVKVQGTPLADTIRLEPGRFLAEFSPTGPVYEYGVWIRVTGQPGATFYPNSWFDRLVVLAGGGNDRVTNSSTRPSVIRGEAGNDSLIGGSGEDAIFGGLDHDTAVGGMGSDFLFGDTGRDELYGDTQEQNPGLAPMGGGDDFLWGGSGHDQIFGGSGNDFLFGGDPTVPNPERRRDHTIDSTTLDSNTDEMFGQHGNDFLNGGGGLDILAGGLGYDTAKRNPLATLSSIDEVV
jgi:Ca2+-binding RTX toxin-like protein